MLYVAGRMIAMRVVSCLVLALMVFLLQVRPTSP
jgi:hypothetical protein